LVCHSIDQLKGQIGEFLIGVDKSLEEGKFRIDIFRDAFLKKIPLPQYLIDLIDPNLIVKQKSLFLIDWCKQSILIMTMPFIHKLLLVILVLTQIDINLHHVLEMFSYDRYANIVFIVYDDVQNLCRKDFTFDEQYYVRLVQLELLLDAGIHLILDLHLT
jgi:hypothetical protein